MKVGILHHGTDYDILPYHRQDQRLMDALQERGLELVGFGIKDPALGLLSEDGSYSVVERTTGSRLDLAGMDLAGVINRNHPTLAELERSVQFLRAFGHANIYTTEDPDVIAVSEFKDWKYARCTERGIPVPDSFALRQSDDPERALAQLQRDVRYVIKVNYGHSGAGILFPRTHTDALQQIADHYDRGIDVLVQERVEQDQECHWHLRVNVIYGEVVSAFKLEASRADAPSNLYAGGHLELYDPSQEERQLASAVAQAQNANWCGVDMMLGVTSSASRRRLYAIEGNDTPGGMAVESDAAIVRIAERLIERLKAERGPTPISNLPRNP